MAVRRTRTLFRLERSGTEVFIALGSNLGDRGAFLADAVTGLRKHGFDVRQVSPLYESEAVDCEPGTPPFWNCVVRGCWPGSPDALLELGQKLERRAGRAANHLPGRARQLDVDIILFGDAVIHTEELSVPHPRARLRGFVMRPLCDLAPGAVFPDRGERADTILNALEPLTGIRSIRGFAVA